MAERFLILSPDARYLDDGVVERAVAGAEFGLSIHRETDHLKLPAEDVARCDGLLVWNTMPIDAALIARLESCRMISRAGVGFDHIDLQAAGAAGIPVSNTPDYGTAEVADHAIALMLALKRGLVSYHEAIVADPVGGFSFRKADNVNRLRGLRFGVIGLGRIGTAAALRAKAFGMEVVAYDPYLPSGQELALDVRRSNSLEVLAAESDVVSCHTPLNAETRGLVGRDLLRAMKPTAILINTSRGAVVDVEAVTLALKERWIAAAGLDVLPQEPPDPAWPLIRAYREQADWARGRLILTPHAAWYSPESQEDARRLSTETLVMYLKTGQLRNCVNAEYLDEARPPDFRRSPEAVQAS